MLGTRKSLENSSTAVSSIPNVFILKGVARRGGSFFLFTYTHLSGEARPARSPSYWGFVCFLFFLFMLLTFTADNI